MDASDVERPGAPPQDRPVCAVRYAERGGAARIPSGVDVRRDYSVGALHGPSDDRVVLTVTLSVTQHGAMRAMNALRADAETEHGLAVVRGTRAHDRRWKRRAIRRVRKMLWLDARTIRALIPAPTLANRCSVEGVSGERLNARLRREHIERTAASTAASLVRSELT